ncbi:hypothetical protein FACS1894177_00270 [Bacteroidia bacterium]|nr:hypothetical protein FACS1894177_00270 [Bacteroidia bacterium]
MFDASPELAGSGAVVQVGGNIEYKKIDTDGDGYISFDELLKSINDYFDGNSGYSSDDIKELNDFFFEQ